MSSFPDADAVLVAYEDHVEALTRLLRAGSALSIDPRSRFYGLAMPAIQDRLRSDRVELRTLLKHRHWLAHGRYWTNKHGALPSPYEAHAAIEDYVAALRAFASDFPMS